MMRTWKKRLIVCLAVVLTVCLGLVGGAAVAQGTAETLRLTFEDEGDLALLAKRAADTDNMTGSAAATVEGGALRIALNASGDYQNVVYAIRDVETADFTLSFDLLANNAAFGVALGMDASKKWSEQSAIVTVLERGVSFVCQEGNTQDYPGYLEGGYLPAPDQPVHVRITVKDGRVTAVQSQGEQAEKALLNGAITLDAAYAHPTQIGFWVSTYFGYSAVSAEAILDNIVLEDRSQGEPVPDVTLNDVELTFDDAADLDKLTLFTDADTAGGLPRAQNPQATVSEGVLTVTTDCSENYAWAEYRFGANALANYELEYEVDVKSGQFWIGTRLKTGVASPDTALYYSMAAGGGQVHTQLMARVGGGLDSSNTASYLALSAGMNTIKLSVVNNQISYTVNGRTKSFVKHEMKGIKGDVGFIVLNEGTQRAESRIARISFRNSEVPFDPDPQQELKLMGGSDFDATFAGAGEGELFVRAFGASGATKTVADGKLRLATGSATSREFAEFRMRAPADTGLVIPNFVFTADVKVLSGQLWIGGGVPLRDSAMAQSLYVSLDPSGNAAIYARKDGTPDNSGEQATYHAFGTGELRIAVKCKDGKLSYFVNGMPQALSAEFDALAGANGQFFLAVVNQNEEAKAEIDNVRFRTGDRAVEMAAPAEKRGYADTEVVKFDGSDREGAQEFADGLTVRNVWGANGSYSFGQDGSLILSAGNPDTMYAMTEYRLGANDLGDFTVSLELEIVSGHLLIATRVPDFTNLFDSCYAAQFGAIAAGEMKSVATMNVLRKSDGTVDQYTFYDGDNGSYKNLGITKFVVRVVMEDNKMSVYIGNDKEPTFNKLPDGSFDPIYQGVRGDLALGVYNSESGPAQTIVRKFQFQNGAHHEWPSADFVQPGLDFGTIDKIGEFTPKASYEVGETISVALDEYFTYSGDGGFDAISFAVAGGIGSVEEGRWTFTPTEEGEYRVSVTGHIVGTDIRNTLSFTVRVGAQKTPAEGGGCSCSGSLGGTSLLGGLLVLGALTFLKRRAK